MTGINHIFARANVIHVSGIKAEQVHSHTLLSNVHHKENTQCINQSNAALPMHTIHSCDSYIKML